MKINVGDYVRSKNGHIGKYLHDYYGDENGAYDDDDGKDSIEILIDEKDGIEFVSVERKEDIVNSSQDIISLIEVGDYVNGYKVISLWKDKTKVIGVAVDGSVIGFDECEIKSIVTKEQFEQMEYEVKE